MNEKRYKWWATKANADRYSHVFKYDQPGYDPYLYDTRYDLRTVELSVFIFNELYPDKVPHAIFLGNGRGEVDGIVKRIINELQEDLC